MSGEGPESNRALARWAPAARRLLSPLGERVTFPRGIPWQAEQARGARLNATIGQVTDGAGAPLPLPVIDEHLGDLDRRVSLLYAPQAGHPELRRLWAARQRALGGDATAPCSLPFTTHGLTHGLSMVADLFVDADTTVVLPTPSWENYELVLGMRTGPRFVRWDMLRDGALNLDGLAAALAGCRGRTVVVLNVPHNPTGWCPTPAEADALRDVALAHSGPTLFLIDDAYLGVVHEPDRERASLYWRFATAADPDRHLVVKVDGATKELLFFPSRTGFLAASVAPEAEAAWEDKLKGLSRGTVGSAPGPSQALMLEALRRPDRLAAETAERLAVVTRRYRTLRAAIAAMHNPRLRPLPFYGAYFAVLTLDASLDAEAVRQSLLAEEVGVIALPSVNGLRVAYCSTRDEDLPELVARVDRAVREA
ncbi:MAG TPA: aminotransferase class I/II-fold pyridoxal phosphate-dependent enzyme [Myxococcota bacterium]|nr:aminotransferase class I/II-fold pyridoxal phosphate-dependent enzyme [Myxococcota bacterium]